jgi:hypothetical protein
MKLITKWTKRKEKSKERIEVCLNCNELREPQGLDPLRHCSQCGCPVAIKTMFPSEECPLGKWKSYTD